MIVRVVSKCVSEAGKKKMPRFIALAISVVLANCNPTGREVAMDDSKSPEVANEAVINLSDTEIQNLKEKAEAGDLKSAQRLANFFTVNFGIDDLNSIRWQLQAARLGDCEQWADLMFLEKEEGFSIPSEFFSKVKTWF